MLLVMHWVKIEAFVYFFAKIFSGAGTALLGKEAAMACTVAVEAVISEHYNK